ncbi:MAG TPA: NfeD family protein [Candidatus Limnocylindria bacterium]|nr:NfeD family protein [Candidatus Limnocylindria bacterium]
MDFIINNLPIIISALVGIALIIVEIFMPGFGIPGVAGTALLLLSVFFTWRQYGMLAGLGVSIVVLAVSGLAIMMSLRSASRGRMSRSPLVLRGSQSREEGFAASEDLSAFIGKAGTTLTVLRPAGIADINGARLDVVSGGEFIPKGAEVIVVQVEGARVLVRKTEG